ncbi:biopolymer transport protein ExbB/TolQ/ABC-type transporter Mla subunit MlaD/ElaB/YqjD/DUF883 family membrane-anchored ribosome-binding protein [Bacillus mesophilus]|uniref:MotA/TolQ/ExbB proton channel domain-containing protein n=1 Tax=Bacillus mesophilus TaxID=1808955 RepID=A0A6M0Q434_9BACI|nr:MotA/TolQ/ExbB proton channel family protein [Bacillus mesophilus]MBM7660382.1 biopolymer transport protein ExbB/TolQ/ABC-type transporter Mla subunit MlaD/ElaB/YqjD/DUF883 family membrane-anchored ribosome-binding protein [Bacillus mesophilus]NEY71091.1 hypothetical protein [Bacillus mesophilus]
MLSLSIIIVTFTLVFLIGSCAIRANHSIYKYLEAESERISLDSKNSSILHQINDKYKMYRTQSDNDLNFQSLIEEFISDFKMVKSKRSILHKYRIVSILKMIQLGSSMTILVGVLGTFIGLVIALKGIDLNLNETMQTVLDGIHTAFYTSIAGIACSIIINIATKVKNTEQQLIQIMLKLENYLNQKEKRSMDHQMVEAIGDVKTAVEEMKQSFLDIQLFTEGFERATENMNSFNEMFSKNTNKLSKIFGNMDKFTQNYNDQMNQLNHNFSDLLSFFEKQEEIQSYSVDLMRRTAEQYMHFTEQQLQVQARNEEQFVRITENLEETSNRLDTFFTTHTDQMHDAFEAMSGFYQESLDRQAQLVESQKHLEDKNVTFLEKIDRATVTMKEILETNSFEELANLTQSFSSNMNEMQQQFRSLISYFEHVDGLQQKYQEFYVRVVEKIDQQAEENSQYQNNFTDFVKEMFKQNEQVQSTFKDTVNLFTMLDSNSSTVTEEMKKLIQQTEHVMTESTNQFKSQTEELQKTLQEYVELSTEKMEKLMLKLDDSLGEGVRDSLRQFERYINVTNSIISQELKSMMKLQETHLGAESLSSINVQQSLSELNQHMKTLNSRIEKVGV